MFPLVASDAYHRGLWKNRPARRFNDLFAGTPAGA
jgi:hypothetical protein